MAPLQTRQVDPDLPVRQVHFGGYCGVADGTRGPQRDICLVAIALQRASEAHDIGESSEPIG